VTNTRNGFSKNLPAAMTWPQIYDPLGNRCCRRRLPRSRCSRCSSCSSG
jgi:hypothetical protein